jgi:hypothetical protein
MTEIITTRTVGGQPKGSTLTVSPSSAALLVSKGYAELTDAPVKVVRKSKATVEVETDHVPDEVRGGGDSPAADRVVAG